MDHKSTQRTACHTERRAGLLDWKTTEVGWSDPCPGATARLHRAVVSLGSLRSSESHGCSLSSLIIWTVTKEKRDS